MDKRSKDTNLKFTKNMKGKIKLKAFRMMLSGSVKPNTSPTTEGQNKNR